MYAAGFPAAPLVRDCDAEPLPIRRFVCHQGRNFERDGHGIQTQLMQASRVIRMLDPELFGFLRAPQSIVLCGTRVTHLGEDDLTTALLTVLLRRRDGAGGVAAVHFPLDSRAVQARDQRPGSSFAVMGIILGGAGHADILRRGAPNAELQADSK